MVISVYFSQQQQNIRIPKIAVMLVLDIGNKHTSISDGKHTLTKLTTIQLQPHNRVEIGLARGIKGVVYDMVVLLGTRYQDEEFSRFAKFYSYDFWRTKWGKIEVGVPGFQGMAPKSKNFNVETLLALYVRKLLLQYKIQYHPPTTTLAHLLSSHKFYIGTSSTADHPHRYALKQCLEIAGIESPIFVSCGHSAVCAYYANVSVNWNGNEKMGLEDSEEICVVEFGDRGAGVGVYRMQGWQERIIEVLECRSINMGGYHLTKILAEYIVQQIKQSKGIDISRHTSYMSLLHSECETVKINAISSEQKEAHIRIPDLPDDSTFGKIVREKQLMEILGKDIDRVVTLIQQLLAKYKNVKEVLLVGGSCIIGQFYKKVTQIAGKNRKVTKLQKQAILDGIISMQKQEIILFDISDAVYEVSGQEGFKKKLMGIGEDIPDRRNQMTRFPAGQLEFNLKITENGKKIAHFLLDSRPSQNQFWLNFEIDRNKLIWLYVKTNKGKIDLIANFEALPPENVHKQTDHLKAYQN